MKNEHLEHRPPENVEIERLWKISRAMLTPETAQA